MKAERVWALHSAHMAVYNTHHIQSTLEEVLRNSDIGWECSQRPPCEHPDWVGSDILIATPLCFRVRVPAAAAGLQPLSCHLREFPQHSRLQTQWQWQRQRRSSGVDLCWIRNVNIASHPCLEWNWAAASRSNMDEILMSCRSRDLELGRKCSIPRFRGFMPACQPACPDPSLPLSEV